MWLCMGELYCVYGCIWGVCVWLCMGLYCVYGCVWGCVCVWLCMELCVYVCVCGVDSGAQTLAFGLTSSTLPSQPFPQPPFSSFKIPGKHQEQDTL